MTNKLTDAEIIKAFECCYTDKGGCDECPYYSREENRCTEAGDFFDLPNKIFALINRREKEYKTLTTRLRKVEHQLDDALKIGEVINAEYKKLQDEYRWLDQESDILKADVENLNRICDEVDAENVSLKAEVERLLKKTQRPQDADPMDFCGVLCDFAEGIIAKTKAEAYKECIEKVEQIICDNTYPDFDINHKAVNVWKAEAFKKINNLLNELVGENK